AGAAQRALPAGRRLGPYRHVRGARWVFGNRNMRVLLTLAWLVGLAVVPEGLAAPLAEQLGTSGKAVGWLLAADPLGYVIGPFLLARFVSRPMRQRTVGLLAIASVAILIGFAAHPNLAVALILLMLSGAVGAYQITLMTTFNNTVPNELRGGAYGVATTGL